MALSPDLSTVTLTGTYVDLQGNPISGSVTFSPQSIIKDTDQNQIIVNQLLRATLDTNGSFSIVLPVTSDTDVTPQPFAYLVEEVFLGGRSFAITLPLGTASPIDIADISPAVDSATAANFITSDQFNSLNNRYIAAEANVDDVDNLFDTVLLAEQAATDAVDDLSSLQKTSLNPLLLMGL